MAAVGARGQVLDAGAGDALDAAVRTDALWLRATSDATREMGGAEADVTRLRLMIDASRGFTLAGGGTLTPNLKAGIRHDGGDAETGVGFELGGGLRYQGEGISIDTKVRTLVAHDDSSYDEWGASFAIRVDPGSDGRGLSLSLTPTWGNAASEAEQLWSTRTAEDLALPVPHKCSLDFIGRKRGASWNSLFCQPLTFSASNKSNGRPVHSRIQRLRDPRIGNGL